MTGPPGMAYWAWFYNCPLLFALHCWPLNYTQNHFGIWVCAHVCTAMHVCDSGAKQGIKYIN